MNLNSENNVRYNDIVKFADDDIFNCPGLPSFVERSVRIRVKTGETRYVKGQAAGPFALLKYKGDWSVTHLPSGIRIVQATSENAGKEVIKRLLRRSLDWDFNDPQCEKAKTLLENAREWYVEFYFDDLTYHKGYTRAEREEKGLTPYDHR